MDIPKDKQQLDHSELRTADTSAVTPSDDSGLLPHQTPVTSGNIAGLGPAVAPAPIRPLQPGDALAGRFRIVRFIAKGGMGEVYEAYDLELRENVALKTVIPQIAADERAIDRFKREIQLAHKVTHPNVCRIYDLVRHSPSTDSAGPPQPILFLTMELLAGVSLAEFVRRRGKLAPPEALPIASGMVQGLAAAHAVGVVHRDFKSSNVMLLPLADGSKRVVVTDFGLARATEPSPNQISLTGANDIVGTPIYVAPEQILNEDVAAAADIYALGIVLYEMVTGTWPFLAETGLATATKRLTEAPRPPIEREPSLDPLWNATILRCLARKPADRFAAVTDVADALAGKIAPARPSKAAFGLRRLLPVAVLAVIAVAAIFGAWSGYKRFAAPRNTIPAVAVLGFRNTGPDADSWIGNTLTETLTTELESGSPVQTIPPSDISRAKAELSITDADALSSENVALLEANLGARYLVTGAYFAEGKGAQRNIRVDVRLVGGDGKAALAFSETGPDNSLSALASHVAARLRTQLGAAALTDQQTTALASLVPSDRQAARYYSEGLTHLRSFDALAARDSLTKAADIEVNSPAVHTALASAWSLLGYDTKAEAEAKKALDLVKDNSDLPEDFRFAVEARYYETSNQWGKAVDVYSSLRRFYPKNLEYGLRLAAAQTSAGKGDDALNTYAALRKLDRPMGQDPRIDLGEADAAGALTRPQDQQKAAQAAARRADHLRAKLLQAPALVYECIAERNLGQFETAKTACNDGKKIYSVFGDKLGEAWATNNIGSILKQKGDFTGARAAYEEALQIVTSVGAQGHIAGALSNLGDSYFSTGDMALAKDYFLKSVSVAHEIADRKGEAIALNNLAAVLYSEGNLTQAALKYGEVAQISRETSDQDGLAYALNNQALMQVQTGELKEAERNYNEALRLWTGIGAKPTMATCHASLAELLALQGESAAANRHLEQAQALAEEIKSKSATASVALSRAVVLLDANEPGQAQNLAADAAAELQKEQDTDSESQANLVLARALIAQGKDPSRPLDRFDKLASRQKTLQLRGQITRAVWLARGSRTSDAQTVLQRVIQETTRLGMVKLELEARLSLAEIGAAEGKKSELNQVRQRARAAGYIAIANRAHS